MNQVSPADYFAVCHTCRHRHPCANLGEYQSFSFNHQGHMVSLLGRDALAARGLDRLASWDPRKVLKSAFGTAAAWALRSAFGDTRDLVRDYIANANVKEAFGGSATLTVTNLNSLARSVTAGWQSAAVDNSSNLFLDDLFLLSFGNVNTAPGNGKVIYVFAGHTIDGTIWTQPFTGSEGACTYPDVTANAITPALLGTIPYTTQNVGPISRALSMAATCSGQLPSKYVVGVINDSGFTFAASGNAVTRNGVYATVV